MKIFSVILICYFLSGALAQRSSGYSLEAIKIFEEFAGRPLPYEVRRNLEQSQNIYLYIRWLTDSNVAVSSLTYATLRTRLLAAGVPSAQISQLEQWYLQRYTPGSGSAWKDVKLPDAAINELQRAIGVQKNPIPDYIKRDMKNVGFYSFSQWAKRQNVQMPAAWWRWVKLRWERLGVSQDSIGALNQWYENVFLNTEDDWENISLPPFAIDELQRLIPSEIIPFSIRKDIENGNFQSFSEWARQNKVKITDSDVKYLSYRLGRIGVAQETVKSLEKWHSDVQLTEERTPLSPAAINQLQLYFVPRAYSLPFEIRSQLREGDLDPFFDWMRESRIRVSGRKIDRFDRVRQRYGIPEGVIDRLRDHRARMREGSRGWGRVRSGTDRWEEIGEGESEEIVDGSDGRDDGASAVPREIQEKIRRIYGRPLPPDMEENLRNGKIELVMDFLSDGGINVPIDVWDDISKWLSDLSSA